MMTDDESRETVDSSAPFMSVDYGIFAITVEGSSGDSISDVNEIAEKQIQEARENIEDLKRLDYILMDEYGQSGSDVQAGMHY